MGQDSSSSSPHHAEPAPHDVTPPTAPATTTAPASPHDATPPAAAAAAAASPSEAGSSRRNRSRRKKEKKKTAQVANRTDVAAQRPPPQPVSNARDADVLKHGVRTTKGQITAIRKSCLEVAAEERASPTSWFHYIPKDIFQYCILPYLRNQRLTAVGALPKKNSAFPVSQALLKREGGMTGVAIQGPNVLLGTGTGLLVLDRATMAVVKRVPNLPIVGLAINHVTGHVLAVSKNEVLELDVTANGTTQPWIVRRIGSPQRGTVYLSKPCGVCCLSNGRIVVTDSSSDCVTVYEQDGTEVGKIGHRQCGVPWGIAEDNHGNLIIADSHHHVIVVMTLTGTVLYEFGTATRLSDAMRHPRGIAVDLDDNIIVADSFGHKVHIFSHSGVLQRSFDCQQPQWVAVEPNGNALVVRGLGSSTELICWGHEAGADMVAPLPKVVRTRGRPTPRSGLRSSSD